MMWRIVVLVIGFSCMPFVVMAQNAKVTSGEHSSFTRIVAPIAAGAEWSIEQDARLVTFLVPSFAGTFDTSDVFRLITRDRVAAISSIPGTLTIELGCDCKVGSFLARDRFVVLDIAAQDVTLTGSILEPASGIQIPFADINLESGGSVPSVELPTITERNPQVFLPRLKPADLPIHARQSLLDSERAALNAMQQRLIKELSAAATRGVLKPQPGRALPDLTKPTGPKDVETNPGEVERTARPANLGGSTRNMRVTSSIDMPSLRGQKQETVSNTGLDCPTNELLNVAGWADNRPFHEQMGEARQNLFGEFDKIDRNWALRQAQIYVHFGFGAEALQTLSLHPTLAMDNPNLEDIANIIENGVALAGSELRALIDCKTDVSLWAILAKEDLNIQHTIDPSFALLALNRLPVHLRKFLAPALSARLLSYGDTVAAATALRSLERLPTTLPTAAKLAQANIALDDGDLDLGAKSLVDVIEDNTEQSPEALIKLINTRLDANQPIEPQTASLVEAYAKEFRGSDIGPELRKAHVLALVKSGQFDLAFVAMEELGGNSSEIAAVNLRLQVLAEVTAAAEDVVFLEYAFEQVPKDFGVIPAELKLKLASRMLQLGFALRAKEIVTSVSERPISSERQILLARISLFLRRPVAALAALKDLTSDDANVLRAEAQLLVGAHNDAYELFLEANQIEAAISAAWLADSPDLEALGNDPVFGPVLALTQTIEENPDTIVGMLERSSAAVQESENARQVLLDLLTAPQLEVRFDEK